ncbi:DNA repair protein RecO [Candidatus Curtissbacteria bacterium RIFCSPLOWO2_02_FULL_40_13b]|uniref:DNA repair protein RecO n=3 Tax=Candidatus Curtissiibacteriota TaxID=1752717 RepID=A0A1F5HPT5_9BACT|nr:MAG: DNA repair protein RecO [Candidatus Curtissbacteria bacterium RIFCSPHIGHO2_01_FULL_40_12]OGE03322.1 MAG: DNA repair protein RecO [Candidatus Curtissbacteria bacterium RIFCSPHIGHO2_12_FULL_41_17]OGE06090.1 MAG: DNA repair protein RecO [Candidatus Curtissbacteria bacterium RIFCSPLOWO2_02_FULL_40_13b]
MYFRTEGVIIGRRNFGEADRILTIYTKDFGKVVALAKGVRRPRSRKGGHVELGNWCKVFIARGKNLDLLTEVELKKAFGIENFSPEKANKIYHLLELTNQMTAEKQKNPGVFILLVNFLKKISKDEDFNLISVSFKVKLLSLLGFFSARNITNIKVKKVLGIVEDEDYERIKQKINLTENSYLKLLSFLDSMIESLIDSQLKTSRFLDGKFQT